MGSSIKPAWLATLALACPACFDDGWHEGDPIDRAVTAWRLMPGLDDTRVAISLEPRKIHRNEQGVLTLNYETSIVGASIAVEGERELATLERGAGEVRIGTTRTWMLQTDQTYWDHVTPASAPPRASFVHATLVDRATFAMTPVPLAPPIETPALVGDVMFDVATGGQSDIERDVFIRRRELDGSVVTLHTGRGFGSASCTRQGGVILVYQLPGGDLRVVATAADSTITELTLPALRFDPLGIACNDAATHVAVFVGTGVSLIDIAAGAVAFHASGLQRPMVVASDGSSIVAARSADHKIVYADATILRDLGLVSADSPESPAFTGDLAMFELEASVAVIDVKLGTVGATVPALHGYMYPFDMKPWRDRFVLQLSDYTSYTYSHELAQMYVVDYESATPLPLPDARQSPSLHIPGDSTLYVKGYDGAPGYDDDAMPHLTAIDLPSKAVVSTYPLPLCEETTVLEERGCR